MPRFDRYLLSQLMTLFAFFALVLVAIYWINSAVRLFDQLISENQSSWVFLEYTALTLPNVIRNTLPMSVFAAAVYVTNRLSGDSELVVMQATGFSPWRLARPALIFGLITAVLMTVMTNFLVPASQQQIQRRNHEISQNVTARLLSEGSFLHPSAGVTFYIREIDEDGTLRDVFLSDRRTPGEPQTYTAARAYIINANDDPEGVPEPKMVMVDGLAQDFHAETGKLFTTHFQDFSYDIAGLVNASDYLGISLRTAPTWQMMTRPQQVADLTGDQIGRIVQEAHGRVTQALVCIVAALIGFAALQIGGFSRFGVWKQIVFAILLLVIVKFAEGVVTGPVRKDATLWPILYLPVLLGLAISCLLLWWAARPRRPRGQAQMTGSPA
ncbi:LPS export ABC transporter permease LptF [Pseudooceanicola sediminis]|uniref:LPS export ABC transporter permease LptF n=1 Tax=Pseudooceanicola sediminis TaxID=2211117 RepID=UPI0018F55003|nr:LPS export ABC transporter permease LptF [Pseudooceanicola sediminis]